VAERPLGKSVPIPTAYAPEVLVALSRDEARARIGLTATDLEGCAGVDRWEADELSWLDERGKPCVARAEFHFPATSPELVESKSLKLYLHSLNQERFGASARVGDRIRRDLSHAVGTDVEVRLTRITDPPSLDRRSLAGRCIDEDEVDITTYALAPELLADACGADEPADETLVTHLFRSLCPVTAQPDWASVSVSYRGMSIDSRALLRYLVSFRETQAFHEACVERILADVREHCRPQALTVEARFAFRGGLAIHPLRYI